MLSLGTNEANIKCYDEADPPVNYGSMRAFSQENHVSMIMDRPVRLRTFALFVVLGGSVKVRANLNTYELKKNELFFALPGSLIQFLNFSQGYSFQALSFSNDYLEHAGVYFKSMQAVQLSTDKISFKYALTKEKADVLANDILSIYNKAKITEPTSYTDAALHHSFLSVVYNTLDVVISNNSYSTNRLGRKEELTSDFLKLVSENFKRERSVRYYADTLFVTSRYLSKVVKKVAGKTCGELIDIAVIKEAKLLLSLRGMNVAQVAETLRFSDQSFFGKYFKKHTGTSPSEFRHSAGYLLVTV
jgi:AraC family transcriptional activator of pobA